MIGDFMCNKDHYFTTHPNCKKVYDGIVAYPADEDGSVLCAKDLGYVKECYAGEGFFDCRDCWDMPFDERIASWPIFGRE